MKTQIKNPTKRFWLILPILLTAFALVAGCAGLVHHSDPLAGWQIAYNQDPSRTIVKDYQDYIQMLPTKQRNDVLVKHYYKDGTGQHAVQIEVGVTGIFNGTLWEHILIYDKDDKRIRVMKYVGGKYSQW